MSVEASIDVQFAKNYSPKEIINRLITVNNLSLSCNDKVYFQYPLSEQHSNWEESDYSGFELKTFLKSHPVDGKVGIAMMFDKKTGMHFIVYPKWMTISLNINRVNLFNSPKIPDFSWYITKLKPFFDEIDILAMQCELVFNKN